MPLPACQARHRRAVGDTQRVTEYAKRGFAIEHEMPSQVQDAYQRLIDAGFTDRLI
jgi:hypothetical protein